ncbi:bifunctional riboflavin kinase/FAD synthetase [Cellulophaga baltica]|uniref:bifunctional riboflavin kinase/FAD synthetase n=1 Tax=Cellulophaga TaxID=104264 RepID=UPI001C07BED3|nr:bifunctional riboflavin kinase/FAD synthetase [Cellulophaga sp. 1_MG-2023]MBU2997814.1 bifunctional riboflavin kinase/FAD synthetase [Cellulophaga baltica]MDO6769210.1 bifunctional riboflavin kinase/FAD synthetase [Cellulophaga sp. 1_MG-2023]
MITFQNISKFDNLHPTAVTIGTFDGVHIGHRKLLERLINDAKLLDLKATVLTFFPHPRMILQQDANIKLLNTLDEKIHILEKIGLDYLMIYPFSREFSRYSATDFVEKILVKGLNSKKIIIGYDHRFGRNRNADIKDLIDYGKTFNFQVDEIPAQEIEDVSVSSTKIRRALEEGDIKTANSYLGYEYMLTGTVKKGKGLGRKIDFPTANIHIEESYKLIPLNGVYVVKSTINNRTVFGMMNIGFNPTVNGTERSIEVHFFDFNNDLYEQKIQINILERIRDEEKFKSVEDLKNQLYKDQKTAINLIAKQ